MNVFVDLMGGLGNQLFQYAYARYLVDSGIPVGGLLVNRFDADAHGRIALATEIASLPTVRLPTGWLDRVAILNDENGARLRTTLAAHLQQTGTVICRGYWQSPTYADQVQDLLVAELLSAAGSGWRDQTDSADCMVHVRRRDYGHHGLLPLGYYLASLERQGWPAFSVVTDEPNFCHHVFSQVQGYAGTLCGDARRPWEDFFRMSKAKCQVIANSSFSWWTAWLGESLGYCATVYAPAEWSLLPYPDPCRPHWQRVPAALIRP